MNASLNHLIAENLRLQRRLEAQDGISEKAKNFAFMNKIALIEEAIAKKEEEMNDLIDLRSKMIYEFNNKTK
jgi:hypothetical protein